MKRKSILWVEDGARYELQYLTGPIYYEGIYQLTIAEDITKAVEWIRKHRTGFDAVIVDIRMPPGSDHEWVQLFQSHGEDAQAAKLGIHFLRSLLSPDFAKIRLVNLPGWISSQRFGVFTVETMDELLENDLNALSVNHFSQKCTEMSELTLLNMIQAITGK